MADGMSIRVLVVDDSALMRSLVRAALQQHPAIEVVGMANDGADALRQIQALRPDVVTLDVEMPNMNGLQVLERVGGKIPVSFVMCSTLTQSGAQITLEALNKGAFDYIGKPQSGGLAGNSEFRHDLHEKVITAARNKGRVRKILRPNVGQRSAAPQLPPNHAKGWVVGIGISCGGPQTLHEMMPAFPSDFVPIVITQHMPAQFTKSFAAHLDAACALRVQEATDGQPLERGLALIAPGSHHMRFVRRGVSIVVKLDDGPKVSGHRPAADLMFSSLARVCGPRCVGVVMTGMGQDGAQGTRELHQAGAWTVAQDEETSLVYGMPKAAAATGCVAHVAPLGRLPMVIAKLLQAGQRSGVAAR